jgi:hypothetical protein
MIDIKDIFTRRPATDIQEALAEADKVLDVTGDMARVCLSSEDFQHYRKMYQHAEAAIMDTLIIYTKNFAEGPSGSTEKYAFTVMRMLTKLQHLKHLIKSIESDAKRGLSEEKENE